MTPDRRLLRRFLEGVLEADELAILEARLDSEPALSAELGAMAREFQKSVGGVEVSDETQRVTIGFSSAGLRPRSTAPEPLTIGPLIGEGGMARVYRGRQHSVDREVAIKTVASPDAGADVLLEEAYITGQLEHPNIVPIHDITVSADGRPQVVLKHIEGQSWSTLIQNEHLVLDLYGATNPLDWHLHVFLQVCQALRFAHSRGIIHRDVKPANVMIGAFDDVYLLDWGLALTIDDDERLPSVTTAMGVAGTPGYMAPEQLERSPESIGPHTDVYLLGATLFEVVAGAPPQSGATLGAIRDSIATRSRVPVPSSCALELAAIIQQAMAPAIADRFGNVTELRQAVESFREHQSSNALAEAGDERATALTTAHAAGDDERADRVFIEGVFSYRMALQAWPANPRAALGLESLVGQRVDQLLDRASPLAAQRVFALLEHPPAALDARLGRALRRHARETERFVRLQRDDDRRVGHRARRLLVLVLGGLWIVGWTQVGYAPPTTLWPVAAATGVYVAAAVVLVWRRRQEMLSVRLNRHISWLIFVVLISQLLLLAGGAWTQTPIPTVLIELLLMWGAITACGAFTVDMRISPAALFFVGSFVLTTWSPAQLQWVMGASATAIVANMLYINRAIARTADHEPGSSAESA